MSSVNSKFKNETLGNNSNTREKIHYLGDLRIVGQVVENLSDKEPIGYVVMTEKNTTVQDVYSWSDNGSFTKIQVCKC